MSYSLEKFAEVLAAQEDRMSNQSTFEIRSVESRPKDKTVKVWIEQLFDNHRVSHCFTFSNDGTIRIHGTGIDVRICLEDLREGITDLAASQARERWLAEKVTNLTGLYDPAHWLAKAQEETK